MMIPRKKNGFILRLSIILLLGMGIGLSALADDSGYTVSASGRFIVHAKERSRRSELLLIAEEMWNNWLKLSKQEAARDAPIIIQWIPRSKMSLRGLSVNLRLLEDDSRTARVQLDLRDQSEIDLRQEILRAILLEQIYDKVKNVAGKPVQFPSSWLIDGALGMMEAWNREPPASLFQRLTEKNEIPDLAEFLKQDSLRLDATSRAIFKAQSMALLRAILDQPNGSKELVTYLSAMSKKEDSERLFISSLRSLGGSVDKVRRHWALAIARYGAALQAHPFSSSQTRDQLSKLLVVDPQHIKGKIPSDEVQGSILLVAIAKEKANYPLLKALHLDLLKLSLRAHPLWKTVVDEYIVIVDRLSKGKRRGMEKRLMELDELRQKLAEHTQKIESYLDWYETTQLSDSSGEFTDLLREEETSRRRTDPISRVLDSIEEQGWK